MRKLWLSCEMATIYVEVDDIHRKVIQDIAPIFRKFLGQSLDNLTLWLSKKGQKITIRELYY